LTRVSSLNFGPGRDPDAWRLLDAAITIARTGRYTMSRPPGYPIPEYVYSLFADNPVPLLQIVAVIGAVGVAFFTLAARRLGCKDYWLATAAVALTPVIYINGTNLMDYTWSLTFVLAAYYFLLADKPLVSGLLTGLAVGSRITAGAMLVPFSVLILMATRPPDRRAVLSMAKLWGACLIVSVICYSPVIVTYGTEALRAVDEQRPLGYILRTMGRDFWSGFGLFAMILALGTLTVHSFTRPPKNTSIPDSLPSFHTWAWIAVVGVYVATFLRLPHEAGYLIYIVPFVILLFARHVTRPVFIVVCVLLAVSPMIGFDGKTFEKGPLKYNRGSRLYYLEETEFILDAAEGLNGDNVIVAGWLTPQLKVSWYYRFYGSRPNTAFEETLPDSVVYNYLTEGRHVYILPNPVYFPDIRDANRLLLVGAEQLMYRGPVEKNQ
jgi:hypothetical protein